MFTAVNIKIASPVIRSYVVWYTFIFTNVSESETSEPVFFTKFHDVISQKILNFVMECSLDRTTRGNCHLSVVFDRFRIENPAVRQAMLTEFPRLSFVPPGSQDGK